MDATKVVKTMTDHCPGPQQHVYFLYIVVFHWPLGSKCKWGSAVDNMETVAVPNDITEERILSHIFWLRKFYLILWPCISGFSYFESSYCAEADLLVPLSTQEDNLSLAVKNWLFSEVCKSSLKTLLGWKWAVLDVILLVTYLPRGGSRILHEGVRPH